MADFGTSPKYKLGHDTGINFNVCNFARRVMNKV